MPKKLSPEVKVALVIGVLTILATLVTAVPGFIELFKTKRAALVYEEKTSSIVFPQNADRKRIKAILGREGIPDSSLVVTLRNAGDQPASEVKITMRVPGSAVAIKLKPPPAENPAWVTFDSIPKEFGASQHVISLTLKNLAVGPKLEIEVSYISDDSDDSNTKAKSEIFADGHEAVLQESPNQQRISFDRRSASALVFVLGSLMTTLVFLKLRIDTTTKSNPGVGRQIRSIIHELRLPAILPILALPEHETIQSRVTLRARDARPVGSHLRFEDDETMENLGYWNSPHDYAEWTVEFEHPGEFLVVVEQACLPGNGGNYTVELGEQRIQAEVVVTGAWVMFIRRKVGLVRVERAGQFTLRVVPVNLNGPSLMNLRTVTLIEQGGD